MRSVDKSFETGNLSGKTDDLLKKKFTVAAEKMSEAETIRLLRELDVRRTELELQTKELIKEKKLVKSIADKYTELYDFAPTGYYTLSDKGDIIDLNIMGSRLIGKERSGLKNRNFGLFISADTRNIFNVFFEKVFQSSSTETCEVALSVSADMPLYIQLTGIAAEGRQQCLLTAVDISLRRKSEKEFEIYRKHLEELVQCRTIELSESETRYREIIDSITDYVYQVKIDGNENTTTIYTESCFPVTGYHSYEFMEDHFLWLNIVAKEDRSKVKNFIISIYSEQGLSEKKIEHRIVHKNGSIRWIQNNIVLHKDSDGKLSGYDGVISDITGRKMYEEEIVNLNQHIIKLQEEERQRVAQDLHDSVGQSLIAAKMSIDTYRQEPDYFKNQLEVGLSFLVKASQELREIYTNLYPTVLNDLGFEMAVKWLVHNTLEKNNIKAFVDVVITIGISHEIEVCLYRIIQEIISNILKHASASVVHLSLNSNENQLKLIIKDNGVGFDHETKKDGINRYGLANIKSRVTSFNGKFNIERNRPHGTIISITAVFQNSAIPV